MKIGNHQCTGEHIRIGSRVYYRDNGPSDTGTVIDILLDEAPFIVKWDQQKPSEFKTTHVVLLPGVEFDFEFNPADENIDQFCANQLAVVEY